MACTLHSPCLPRSFPSTELYKGSGALVQMQGIEQAAVAIQTLNGSFPRGATQPLLVRFADSPGAPVLSLRECMHTVDPPTRNLSAQAALLKAPWERARTLQEFSLALPTGHCVLTARADHACAPPLPVPACSREGSQAAAQGAADAEAAGGGRGPLWRQQPAGAGGAAAASAAWPGAWGRGERAAVLGVQAAFCVLFLFFGLVFWYRQGVLAMRACRLPVAASQPCPPPYLPACAGHGQQRPRLHVGQQHWQQPGAVCRPAIYALPAGRLLRQQVQGCRLCAGCVQAVYV